MHVAANHPSAQSRIAGATTAIALTGAIAALASTAAISAQLKPEAAIQFVAILDAPHVQPTKLPAAMANPDIHLSAPSVFDLELPDFVFERAEAERPAGAPVSSPGGGAPRVEVAGTVERAAVIVEPVMKNTRVARYPQESRKRNETGTTTMHYCVTAAGKVRDVEIVASSGHSRLDDAAVKWLRTRDHIPGTLDGAPTDMCGLFDYNWVFDPFSPATG